MLITLTALTLASTLLAPTPQEPTSENTGRRGRQQVDAERASERMESKLGFTIYEPRSLSVRDLMRYASELTDDKVRYVYEDATSGVMQVGTRHRFIIMGEVIGVQDFEEGRKAAMAVLLDIDTRLGAVKSGDSAPERASKTQVRTVRLRTLDMRTATMLVNNISPELAVSPIVETGTIVLRGPVEAVGIAESLLREVDQPLPQVTLRCALIQAIDPDDKDTDVEGTDGLMDGEVAQSLGRLLPGKRFRKVGELLLRGSAGGNAEFNVTSSLPELGKHAPSAAIPPARVTFHATARVFDPETKTLTLDNCSMELEVPTIQVTSNGQGSTQQNFAGYRTEGLRADLALRAGETTVVGSLGGDQIYISLSFEIEE